MHDTAPQRRVQDNVDEQQSTVVSSTGGKLPGFLDSGTTATISSENDAQIMTCQYAHSSLLVRTEDPFIYWRTTQKPRGSSVGLHENIRTSRLLLLVPSAFFRQRVK